MGKQNLRKILGYNVKYYRYMIGYTQEQLAEKTDLSPRYISDIENEKGNIALDNIGVLADVLRVEAYLLLQKQEPKKLPKRVNMQ